MKLKVLRLMMLVMSSKKGGKFKAQLRQELGDLGRKEGEVQSRLRQGPGGGGGPGRDGERAGPGVLTYGRHCSGVRAGVSGSGTTITEGRAEHKR